MPLSCQSHLDSDVVRDRGRRDDHLSVELLLEPLREDLHVEDAKEAEPPALAQGEAALHGHAHAPIVQSESLYRSLQFLRLALVKWVDPSKHHWLKN